MVRAHVNMALRLVQAAGHGIAPEHVPVRGVGSRPDDQELGSGADDKQDRGGLTTLYAQSYRNVRPVLPETRDELAERGLGGYGGLLVGVFGYDAYDVEFGVPQACLREGAPERGE
jgi:hypothetical protein